MRHHAAQEIIRRVDAELGGLTRAQGIARYRVTRTGETAGGIVGTAILDAEKPGDAPADVLERGALVPPRVECRERNVDYRAGGWVGGVGHQGFGMRSVLLIMSEPEAK